MAGVYIPGMDIPRCCEDCKLYNAEYDYCNYNNCTVGYEYSNKRMDDCPLVEVPDHGDLIDRDALRIIWGRTNGKMFFSKLLKDAPVVIPADRREELL